MKLKVILLALILPALEIASAADWHIVPTDITEDLTGMFLIDESNGYLVSKDGSIFKFILTDTGFKYDRTSSHNSLNSICFPANDKMGIALGNKGKILRTEDYGLHWLTDSMSITYSFKDLIFLDTLTGIIVGTDYKKGAASEGIVFKTEDGGRSWAPLDAKGKRFYYVNKSPEGILTIIGQHFMHISRDSGTSWQKEQIPAGGNARAIAVRGSNGIMVGKSGFLALSNDGGKKWETMPILNEAISFHDLLMIDSLRAYIIGSTGEILYTEDSGHNWIPQPSGAVFDLFDIRRAGNKIYVCGKKGTLIYTDLEK